MMDAIVSICSKFRVCSVFDRSIDFKLSVPIGLNQVALLSSISMDKHRNTEPGSSTNIDIALSSRLIAGVSLSLVSLLSFVLQNIMSHRLLSTTEDALVLLSD